MPKKTFDTIEVEKKNNLIEAALFEFSKSTFSEVKISSIIKRAKIPRSSFYDYFENKEDIYRYLIQDIGNKKNELFESIDIESLSFFETLEVLFKTGIEFSLKHPLYDDLYKQILKDQAVVSKLVDQPFDLSGYYKLLLVKGISSNEINEDIDIDFYAHVLSTLLTHLLKDYATEENESSVQMIEEVTNKYMSFLKNGLKKDIK